MFKYTHDSEPQAQADIHPHTQERWHQHTCMVDPARGGRTGDTGHTQAPHATSPTPSTARIRQLRGGAWPLRQTAEPVQLPPGAVRGLPAPQEQAEPEGVIP